MMDDDDDLPRKKLPPSLYSLNLARKPLFVTCKLENRF